MKRLSLLQQQDVQHQGLLQKLRLSTTCVHIQCKGYVWPLQKLNVEFQILKEADIIIIDMSTWYRLNIMKLTTI